MPWPARSGAEKLQTVVAAMARVPTFTLYERVTSDSSTGPGLVRPLVMSGKDFLGVEPYGSGATFSAVPPKIEGFGTFPVRAFARARYPVE